MKQTQKIVAKLGTTRRCPCRSALCRQYRSRKIFNKVERLVTCLLWIMELEKWNLLGQVLPELIKAVKERLLLRLRGKEKNGKWGCRFLEGSNEPFFLIIFGLWVSPFPCSKCSFLVDIFLSKSSPLVNFCFLL